MRTFTSCAVGGAAEEEPRAQGRKGRRSAQNRSGGAAARHRQVPQLPRQHLPPGQFQPCLSQEHAGLVYGVPRIQEPGAHSSAAGEEV